MKKIYCRKCGAEAKLDDRTGCFYDCPNCGQLEGKDIKKEITSE